MATEPIPENYATEREYAQAWAAYKNLEGARRLASLNLSNDDGQNSGSVRTAADSSGSTTMTNSEITGQRSGQDSNSGRPGIRRHNVLSEFSSFNYALTLYMVSSDAAAQFIKSGGKFQANRPDVFVVAQSAGVNNVAEKRFITKSGKLGPGQAGNDYYIDDLSFITYMPNNAASGPTASIDIKFKITEPLGFSFVGDLAEMSTRMNQFNSGAGAADKFQQNFIIGIKFYGYDVNGVPMKSSNPLFSGFQNGSVDQNSVAERYFNILINKFTYSIDERSTEYSIEAAIQSEQSTNGQVNGATKGTIALSGRTVRDVLLGSGVTEDSAPSSGKSLIEVLNQKNEDLKEKGYTAQATTYNIVFLDKNGKPDFNGPIASATLPNNTDVNLQNVPMSAANSTNDVTVKNSVNAKTADVTKQTVTVTAGAAILNVIDKVITNSSYITSKLNKTTDQSAESSSKPTPPSGKLDWFSVVETAIPRGVDPKTNLQTVDITYEIRPKEVTYVKSEYVDQTTSYQGPFKYYEYMFTGKNTEILKYEQTFNAQYFLTTATTDSKIISKNIPNNGTPTIPRGASSGDDSSVKINQGSTIPSDVRTNLYSMNDQVEAKIKIAGDPDYIMTGIGVSQQRSESTDSIVARYHQPDLSINPFSTQVLIEIRFNSPSDYTDKGLLEVRNNIQFYRAQYYDELRAKGITGIVYEVISVESSFSKGVFTQTLDLLIVPDDALLGKKGSSAADGREITGGSSGTSGGNGITTVNSNADVRSVKYSSDEEADLAYEQSNYTIGEDYFSGVASNGVQPQSPNDDKNLPPPRPTPTTTEVSERIQQLNFESTGIEGITQIVAP